VVVIEYQTLGGAAEVTAHFLVEDHGNLLGGHPIRARNLIVAPAEALSQVQLVAASDLAGNGSWSRSVRVDPCPRDTVERA
jgi:hypothetical protein